MGVLIVATYLKRLIETAIAEQSEVMGCIAIEGPKWCGKSTTAKRFAKTLIELQFKETYEKYRLLEYNDSRKMLDGAKPILFDEWQKIPSLWDAIRAEIDVVGGKGEYFLTGSSKPIVDKYRHSGIGRIIKLVMRPMSLWESNESTGDVSLQALFNGADKIAGDANLDISRLAFLTCRGGWPETVSMKDKNALLVAKNYFKMLVDEDITDVDGIKRNPERAKLILRAYARQVSSLASNRTIQHDVESVGVDEKTLSSYLNAFRKLFVIEDVSAWSPKLRSKTSLRTSPKRQFVDPSLAAQALNATPEILLDDVKTFGLLFESLCTRDLRIYTESLGGGIYHYHDQKDLEADIIVQLDNGNWGAVEIKLGGHQIEAAAKNLLKLKERIDTESMREPNFLMVLTGLDYAYRRRKDGIYVVPIGCLKN
jgi:predicted AAA+ superfamily ATPase